MSDPREYLKLKYMGDCKCGNCQLVPPEMLAQWADEIERLRAQVERIKRAADSLLIEIEDSHQHGFDAHEDGCTECEAIKALQLALGGTP